MTDNIQNGLAKFSQKIENKEVSPVTEDTIVSNGEIVKTPEASKEDDIFEGAVISGLDNTEEEDDSFNMQDRWRRALRERMADMANRSPDQFKSESDKVVLELLEYRKDLMIKYGLTAEEADKAADNRLNKRGTELNTNYLKENPELTVITIDKNKSENLEFTEDEKQKLVRTKTIRLVEVEDKDLATIKIKTTADNDILFKAIHRVSCNLSKYSMPVINTFDVCQFSGATTTQLVQAVYNESDNMYRKYQEQLELVYAKFIGSTTIDKYDAEGNVIFTKEDFSKWFRFHDLPTAMYSIYVASSTEEITSSFSCPKTDGGCGEDYNFTYNTKSLIKYNDIPDTYKQDLDDILAHEDDREGMTALKEERRDTKRFKSPYTKNIYDISAPSVARALSILRYVRPNDNYAQYLSLYAMMIESILVYDPTDNQYFKISYDSDDGPLNIMRYMYDINDMEIKLVTNMIDNITYVPSFEIKTKCAHCGKIRTSEFSIDELVFLKAQNIGEEIESSTNTASM